MNADELFQLAEDSRFIEGIYNYCDRWCQRCPFTSRCLNYAQVQITEDERGFDPTDHAAENARFWQMLQEPIHIDRELLERIAAERGINLHSEEFQSTLLEAEAEHEQRVETASAHYLTQLAEEYGFAVETWFKRVNAGLQRRLQQAGSSGESRADELQAEDVESALQVIRWYQFFPAAKLVGVLSAEKADATTHSGDGRIKVALIGIDRSLLAWGRLQLFWPQAAREIMHFASLLSELRLWMEWAFPNARDFHRPGFDEASARLI